MRAARRAAFVFVALCASVLALAPGARAAAAAGGVSFSVSGPGEVRVDPGHKSTTTLTVRNPSKQDQHIEIDVTGLRVSKGQFDFRGKPSPGITVTARPRTFVVTPGNARDVLVTVDASKNANAGGAYAGLIVRGVPQTKPGQSPVVGEVGVPLFATVSGTASDAGRIAGFRADRETFGTTPFTFSIDFRNTGSVHYSPHGTVELFSAGRSLGTAPVVGAPVLPGTTRTLHARWAAGAPAGRLRATVHLAWGASDHRKDTATTTFSYVLGAGGGTQTPSPKPQHRTSLWLPGLLALLPPLVGLVLFLLWKRRRDRARRSGAATSQKLDSAHHAERLEESRASDPA
jgi:hypothetical protein